MIADISFIERRIEEKYSAARKKLRAQKRTPLYTLLALAIMVTGTLGGYLTLSQAATATRRAPLVFQGRITDANYVPLADTSSRKMLFRIWSSTDTSAASDGGGTCAWSTGNSDGGTANTAGEGLTNCGLAGSSSTLTSTVGDTASVPVTITRGVFSVPLGDTSFDSSNRMPVMSQAFDNQSSEVYYIEIFVQNDTGTYERLSPRVRIGAAPYAYSADELDGLNSTSFLRVDGTTTQTASTSGSPTAIAFTGAAHTTLTAAEISDINFNLARTVQFTGSTTPGAANITNQRAVRIQSPTYSFSSTGAQTITNAATMSIEGMPIASTNATIASNSALWITGTTTSTAGNLLHTSYPSATTSTGTVVGNYLNLASLAVGTNTEAYGYYVNTPSVSNNAATNTTTYGMFIDGFQNASTRLTHSAGAGVDTWYGLRIYLPNQLQTTGTVTSIGLSIERPAAEESGTTYALTTNANAGNVGIGATAPVTTLDLSGNLRTTGKATAVLTGSIDPAASTAVTGVGTRFTSELTVGDRITVTGETRTVTAITDNTNLTVDIAFSNNANDTEPDVLYALATFRDSSNNLRFTINDQGAVSYTPSSTQSITAVGNTILANAAMIVLDPNSDYTLTSAPTIANGATGQIIYITAGNGEANTVTLQDQDSLAGSNLQLGAPSRAVSGKDVLVLMFDGTDWAEVSFANN